MTCLAPALIANLHHLVSIVNCTDRILYIHAENASSASNVEDDLILEDVAVLVDGIAV